MSDESAPPPTDGYDSQPHTQDLPAYQPPPPEQYPGPPAWAAPVRAETRLRRRERVLLTLSILLALSLALVLALPAMIGHTSVGEDAATLQRAGSAIGPGGQAPGARGLGSDLRAGAVYVQTNDARGNEVVAFARRADGTLREVGRFATGGRGSGSFEDSAQGVVLGSADGQTSPIHTVDRADLLFVPNAGSSTVSVFRVEADRLVLAAQTPSGGQKPVSLALSHGLLYVLNSGEFDNRLVVGQGVLENCTTGQLPSVTGFRVGADGMLSQIAGSTRLLTGAAESGCSQISFSPDGRTLVAAERIAGKRDKATGHGRGALLTFPVRPDGTLGAKQVTDPTGDGPYAFTFTRDGTLLAVEQNGGFTNVGGGRVMSYTLNPDGTLRPVGRPVATSGTDTCWIVLTNDQRLTFTTSPFGASRISAFTVGKTGAMTLLHPVASAPDGKDIANKRSGDLVADEALSRDSRYLYVLEGLNADVYAYQVNENGTLSPLGKYHVVNLPSIDQGWQGGPFGIVAY